MRKAKTKAQRPGDRQLSVWLPEVFLEKFQGYCVKRKATDPLHRITVKSIVYDALTEAMNKHPEN